MHKNKSPNLLFLGEKFFKQKTPASQALQNSGL